VTHSISENQINDFYFTLYPSRTQNGPQIYNPLPPNVYILKVWSLISNIILFSVFRVITDLLVILTVFSFVSEMCVRPDSLSFGRHSMLNMGAGGGEPK
jgi:hypothetical protein